MDAKNLAELYDLRTLDWAPVAARLDAGYSMAPGTGPVLGPGLFRTASKKLTACWTL